MKKLDMENKLLRPDDNKEEAKEISELEKYIESIKDVVEQLQQGIDIKSCKCSYYPLRATVEMALEWQIWEWFRLIKTGDEDMIIDLANMFINNKKLWETK